MVVVVDPVRPVTTPVAEILPSSGLLLVHAPPAVVEFNVVVKPTHTANEGLAVIGAGLGLIVTTAVLIHVVGRV